MISLIVANSAVHLSPGQMVAGSGTASGPSYDDFYKNFQVDSSDEENDEDDPTKLGNEPTAEVKDYYGGDIAFPDCRPTLVVCPLSVMSNWQDQAIAHLGQNCLAVTIYHGAKKIKDVEFLARQDLVITTYGTISSEFVEKKDERGTLSRVKWRRVILDEAHYIRNPSTNMSKACLRIQAAYRWALTGTPLQNKVSDLQPLFALIGEEVFSDRQNFGKFITGPIKNQKAEGFFRLRTLMISACLRRTKDSLDDRGRPLVNIPPKHLHVVRLLQTEREELFYKAFDTQAKDLFEKLESAGAECVREKYQFLLCIILRLRQLCNHPALCKDIKEFFDNAHREVDAGGDGAETAAVLAARDGCCMCDSATASFVTCCMHAFCEEHIVGVQESSQCSSCLEQLDLDQDVQKIRTSTKGKRARKQRLRLADGQEPSTKMMKVLDIIREVSKSGLEKAKTVVFSQFTEMLDILEDHIRDNGFSCCRIDGSVSQSGRVAAMAAFNSANPGSPTVMLASLMAAGTGINLKGGSNVVIVDPWWNPAVEDQAIDRVHRIGQTVDVHVHRLVIAGSIEERLLDVHEAKAQLATAALVLRSKEELKNLNLVMMRKLFTGTSKYVRGRRGRLEEEAGPPVCGFPQRN